ncbi:hypothetical protein [Paraburkholderia hospita]|uniref:hypothetical protein n=1 Tax=Paraburkholderia hospita TaxID=169430 RepID=UPI00117847E1|nr:hypothetical protein [Paraburkholderia hospita]
MQVLLSGADMRAVHPAVFMPAFSQSYTNEEIAVVSNYVIQAFGGREGKVTPEFVNGSRTRK